MTPASPAAPPPRLLDAGDAAFTIEFGEHIDANLLAAVAALDAAIGHEQAAGRLPGLVETMPTFRSLTVFFDPLRTGRAALIGQLQPLLNGAAVAMAPPSRRWCLPACYEGDAGPDLQETAARVGLGADAVVALHSGIRFRVYMLGFLPGFAFMGELPELLRLPRRTEPRVRVPAGSVAIAGPLTAVYPWQSPGGWHLLGRCPVPLFNATRAQPALLTVGDELQFEPVSHADYQRFDAALRGGEIDPSHWLRAAEEAAP